MNERSKWTIFSSYFLCFLTISTIGWTWETYYFIATKQFEFVERGFLNGPWCPIYGFAIFGVYLLFGTPQQPARIISFLKNTPAIIRYFIYFLSATIIPTILELVVSIFFENAFGLILWRYTDDLMFISKYISLLVSVIWGVGITIIMRFIFDQLRNAFLTSNKTTRTFLFYLLGCIFLLDALTSFILI